MNEDTRKLLEECSRGCKMAVDSINQTEEYVQDGELKKVLDNYKNKHEEIGKETTQLLEKSEQTEKSPSMAASTFSWITTEMKLMVKDDNHQIAKLMMNGCNMGIQSISEHQNQYAEAAKESKDTAKRLVKTEEEFMKALEKFL